MLPHCLRATWRFRKYSFYIAYLGAGRPLHGGTIESSLTNGTSSITSRSSNWRQYNVSPTAFGIHAPVLGQVYVQPKSNNRNHVGIEVGANSVILGHIAQLPNLMANGVPAAAGVLQNGLSYLTGTNNNNQPKYQQYPYAGSDAYNNHQLAQQRKNNNFYDQYQGQFPLQVGPNGNYSNIASISNGWWAGSCGRWQYPLSMNVGAHRHRSLNVWDFHILLSIWRSINAYMLSQNNNKLLTFSIQSSQRIMCTREKCHCNCLIFYSLQMQHNAPKSMKEQRFLLHNSKM